MNCIARSTIDRYGLDYLHLPIPNWLAPSWEQIKQFVGFCDRKHKEDTAVAVHCLAGKGRTGTMLACYLVWTGRAANEAIRTVREKRPGSIETACQEQAIYQFQQWLNQCRPG